MFIAENNKGQAYSFAEPDKFLQQISAQYSEDDNRYVESYQLFLERSSEHQCMLDFIHGLLPDILDSVEGERSSLNIMGVGCGTGAIDLGILSQVHLKHPGLKVNYEVVEPSDGMLYNYKVSASKTPNLEYVNFKWNQMTANEFENHWREKNLSNKMDFIHMIQMLYHVADPSATVSFFRSLLNKNGKLMIVLVSDKSGWGKLWKTFKVELSKGNTDQWGLTMGDIKSCLDADGIKYKNYQLRSQLDITGCFREDDEKGELLLDFLTGVLKFRKAIPPELKAGVMELLRHPDCSAQVDGKIVFNNTLEALVLDA